MCRHCLLYTSGLMCNEDGYEEPFGDVTVNLSVAADVYKRQAIPDRKAEKEAIQSGMEV